MNSSNLSKDSINHLRNLVSKANLKEVIDSLMSIETEFKNEVILISSRYSYLNKKISDGTIAEPSEYLELNKITSSILNVLGKVENEVLINNISKEKINELKKINFNNLPKNLKNEKSKLINSIEDFINGLIFSSEIEIQNPQFEDESKILLIGEVVDLINNFRLEHEDYASKLDPELSSINKGEIFNQKFSKQYLSKFKDLFNKLDSIGLGIRIYEIPEPVSKLLPRFFEKSNNWEKGLAALALVLLPFSLMILYPLLFSSGVISKNKAYRIVIYEKTE